MRGTAARTMVVAGALVVRKWLIAPESRIAHHFIVATSTLTCFEEDGDCKGVVVGWGWVTICIN
jgi:hypothetical protein